jgi:7tm Chemosensory receptor
MKIFVQIFHELCDAVDSINQLFTFQLTPTMFLMTVIDIFGAYGIIREHFTTTDDAKSQNEKDPHYYETGIYLIISNVVYSSTQFFFKAWAASVGHACYSEAEKTKVILAKIMNRMSPVNISRCDFYAALMQCHTRNLKLQNQFFIIDWSIVFAVSHFDGINPSLSA